LKAIEKTGNTLFHHAALVGDADALNKAKGLPGATEKFKQWINQSNNEGETPLHLALESGQAEFALALIKEGADTARLNHFSESMLQSAVRSGNLECVKLAFGFSDLAHLNGLGATALHLAAQSSNPEILKYLLSQGGAKHLPEKADIFGRTAFSIAVENKNDELIRFLRPDVKEIAQLPGYGVKPPHIEQKSIMPNLMRFIALKQSGYRSPAPHEVGRAEIPNQGVCNALNFLYFYYRSRGKTQEFYEMLRLVASWDGSQQQLEKKAGWFSSWWPAGKSGEPDIKHLSGSYRSLGEFMEQFTNDILWFQYAEPLGMATDKVQLMRAEMYNLVKKGDAGEIVTNLSPVFLELDTKQLAEIIQIYQLQPNLILEIGGSGHVVGMTTNKEGKIEYYDTNMPLPTKPFDSSDEVAETVRKTKFGGMPPAPETRNQTVLGAFHFQESGYQKPYIDPKKVEELLNSPSPNGFTPLHKAVLLNSEDAIFDLQSNDLKGMLEEKDAHGRTALELAILNNSPIAETLVKEGARLDNRLFNLALEVHNLKVIESLLEASESSGTPFNLNGQFAFGTPLQRAAKAGDVPLVRVLIKYEADPNYGSPSPLDMARQAKDEEVLNALQQSLWEVI
jgi:ankyrin repeat protein